MTTNEWKVYNFIKERSIKGIWTKQQDIKDYLLNEENIDVCKRQIRKYIKNIRKDDVIQKIILTDYSKGYRLMSNEEEIDYLKKRKISILKMLKQYYKDVNRLGHNNQNRLTFSTKEREFIESIINIKE